MGSYNAPVANGFIHEDCVGNAVIGSDGIERM